MKIGIWVLPKDIRISIVGAAENVELIVLFVMKRFFLVKPLIISNFRFNVLLVASFDTREYLRHHCRFSSESSIVNWKGMTWEICTLKYPCVIGGPSHIVAIDEGAWTKRQYNKGRQVNNQWIFGGIDWECKDCFSRSSWCCHSSTDHRKIYSTRNDNL